MKTFIGGIGCFWDEKKYEGIDGIISTECGYCGGDEPNVTYKAVCGGDTGHIEVVKVQYDEKKNLMRIWLDYFLNFTTPHKLIVRVHMLGFNIDQKFFMQMMMKKRLLKKY